MKRAPKCGFCGRKGDRVRMLLAGRVKPQALICDVCILKAMHALVDHVARSAR